jgi:hypothetical protein
MRIRCCNCGSIVSNEVPDGTVIRAWIECPSCSYLGCKDRSESKDTLVDELKAQTYATVALYNENQELRGKLKSAEEGIIHLKQLLDEARCPRFDDCDLR